MVKKIGHNSGVKKLKGQNQVVRGGRKGAEKERQIYLKTQGGGEKIRWRCARKDVLGLGNSTAEFSPNGNFPRGLVLRTGPCLEWKSLRTVRGGGRQTYGGGAAVGTWGEGAP